MNNLQLAKDSNTLPETLKLLATDNNWKVRRWVAQHPNTLPETLKILATDDTWKVRYYAAHHPNATEIVRRLYLMTQAQKTSSTTGT